MKKLLGVVAVPVIAAGALLSSAPLAGLADSPDTSAGAGLVDYYAASWGSYGSEEQLSSEDIYFSTTLLNPSWLSTGDGFKPICDDSFEAQSVIEFYVGGINTPEIPLSESEGTISCEGSTVTVENFPEELIPDGANEYSIVALFARPGGENWVNYFFSSFVGSDRDHFPLVNTSSLTSPDFDSSYSLAAQALDRTNINKSELLAGFDVSAWSGIEDFHGPLFEIAAHPYSFEEEIGDGDPPIYEEVTVEATPICEPLSAKVVLTTIWDEDIEIPVTPVCENGKISVSIPVGQDLEYIKAAIGIVYFNTPMQGTDYLFDIEMFKLEEDGAISSEVEEEYAISTNMSPDYGIETRLQAENFATSDWSAIESERSGWLDYNISRIIQWDGVNSSRSVRLTIANYGTEVLENLLIENTNPFPAALAPEGVEIEGGWSCKFPGDDTSYPLGEVKLEFLEKVECTATLPALTMKDWYSGSPYSLFSRNILEVHATNIIPACPGDDDEEGWENWPEDEYCIPGGGLDVTTSSIPNILEVSASIPSLEVEKLGRKSEEDNWESLILFEPEEDLTDIEMKFIIRNNGSDQLGLRMSNLPLDSGAMSNWRNNYPNNTSWEDTTFFGNPAVWELVDLDGIEGEKAISCSKEQSPPFNGIDKDLDVYVLSPGEEMECTGGLLQKLSEDAPNHLDEMKVTAWNQSRCWYEPAPARGLPPIDQPGGWDSIRDHDKNNPACLVEGSGWFAASIGDLEGEPSISVVKEGWDDVSESWESSIFQTVGPNVSRDMKITITNTGTVPIKSLEFGDITYNGVDVDWGVEGSGELFYNNDFYDKFDLECSSNEETKKLSEVYLNPGEETTCGGVLPALGEEFVHEDAVVVFGQADSIQCFFSDSSDCTVHSDSVFRSDWKNVVLEVEKQGYDPVDGEWKSVIDLDSPEDIAVRVIIRNSGEHGYISFGAKAIPDATPFEDETLVGDDVVWDTSDYDSGDIYYNCSKNIEGSPLASLDFINLAPGESATCLGMLPSTEFNHKDVVTIRGSSCSQNEKAVGASNTKDSPCALEASGTFEMNINTAAAPIVSLPSSGGVGALMFFVLGAFLFGSSVVLVKRRF